MPVDDLAAKRSLRGHWTELTATIRDQPAIDLSDRAASPDGEPTGSAPTISVLLPVWNEEKNLPPLFDDLSSQSFSDFEIIIVDGGSEDSTIDLAEAAGSTLPIRVLSVDEPSTPGQLNTALGHARGRFVARVDGHTRLHKDYFRTIVEHLDAGYKGVGVRKRAVGQSRFGKALARALNSELGTGGSKYHSSTSVEEVDHVPYAAYPTDLIRSLGGWDERFLSNQDVELDARVRAKGGRLVLDGTIETIWLSKNSGRQAWNQFRRYGYGRGMTVRVHPETLRPRHLALAALSGLTVIALVVTPMYPIAIGVPGGVVALNVAIALADRLAAPRSGDEPLSPADVILQAAAMTVTQYGWGAGYLQALLNPFALTGHSADRRRSAKRPGSYA